MLKIRTEQKKTCSVEPYQILFVNTPSLLSLKYLGNNFLVSLEQNTSGCYNIKTYISLGSLNLKVITLSLYILVSVKAWATKKDKKIPNNISVQCNIIKWRLVMNNKGIHIIRITGEYIRLLLHLLRSFQRREISIQKTRIILFILGI